MVTQHNNNIIIVIWDSPSRHHRHLCSGGCPGHYRMVSSILGFYSPGHNSPPSLVATAKNVSRYCQMCWGRGGGYRFSTWLSNLLAQTWLKTTGLCYRKQTLFFLKKVTELLRIVTDSITDVFILMSQPTKHTCSSSQRNVFIISTENIRLDYFIQFIKPS